MSDSPSLSQQQYRQQQIISNFLVPEIYKLSSDIMHVESISWTNAYILSILAKIPFKIISKPSAIAVIISIKNIVVIAFRGTQKLDDWKTNLNTSEFYIPLREETQANKEIKLLFHSGFYHAVEECFRDIYDTLSDKKISYRNIFVTGHSLGGALAAIFYSLFSSNNKLPFWDPLTPKNILFINV